MTSFAKKWTPPASWVAGNNASWASVQVALWNDIHVNMLASGLVQTNDTGQLDFSTVTGPGPASTTRTTFGYRMYAFNDTLQGTAPIYIKFTYGTAQLANSTTDVTYRNGTILVEIGTGSNGTGTLLNTIQSTYYPTSNNSAGGGAVTYNTAQVSAICYNESAGFFGLVYYPGCSMPGNILKHSLCSFFIQRSTDSSFVPTADGFCVYSANGQNGALSGAATTPMTNYYYSYATGIPGLLTGTNWSPRIGNGTNSTTPTGASVQRTWMLTPYVKEHPSLLSYSTADIAAMTEMSINDNGNTKNFIALPVSIGAYPSDLQIYNAAYAMRFE
jgi:hypothetical protein